MSISNIFVILKTKGKIIYETNDENSNTRKMTGYKEIVFLSLHYFILGFMLLLTLCRSYHNGKFCLNRRPQM